MRKLTTGEWRLFLLSDCIKYFKDIDEHTRPLRKEGKDAVLAMNGDDSKELDNFLDDTDAKTVRGMMLKEWIFTGAVKDNGKGNKTTCEYCQKQQIRYRYLCKNVKTGMWLSLGSVCVGYVIHGEAKMKDKEFANKFVEDLDKLKGRTSEEFSDEISYDAVKEIREQQRTKISLYTAYLYNHGITTNNNEFLSSLRERWHNGKTLTDGQMTAIENMCRKLKYNEPVTFKSLDAEIQYQKVLLKLQDRPDSEFYKSCKLRLERDGELTPKMAKALMGGA
jgi:hypothetical protein